MTFVLGESEKPVVSCYALGEWRVSPDYFLYAHHFYVLIYLVLTYLTCKVQVQGKYFFQGTSSLMLRYSGQTMMMISP